MKKTIFIIYLLLTIFLLNSCIDKEKPIGIWDDNIKLSTKSVNFNAKTDSVIIKTQGDWWWVAEISFNDSIYQYYGREDIDLESNFYSIKEENFVVERRNKNTLFIKMNENTTGNDRILRITLEAGDYFDHIWIEQKAN